MNRDEIQKNILLKQSGEIKREDLRALNAHLASHPEDAREEAVYEEVVQAYTDSRPPIPALGDFAMARILNEARQLQKTPQAPHALRHSPLAWAAAAALLMAGTWTVLRTNHPPAFVGASAPVVVAALNKVATTPVLDQRLEQLSLEMALSADDLLSGDSESIWLPLEDDIDTLARELLALTGEQI